MNAEIKCRRRILLLDGERLLKIAAGERFTGSIRHLQLARIDLKLQRSIKRHKNPEGVPLVIIHTGNTAVTWSISPNTGTISASGLYTAPSTVTMQQIVTVSATSQADSTKSAAATITLTPPVEVSVSPVSVSLGGSETRQFTATVTNATNTSVTWSSTPNVGTISSVGLYTAPTVVSANLSVILTATSQADTSKTASATVALVPVNVSVSPAGATLYASGTQQFTATVTNTGNTAVTWSVSPNTGTITASGLYTAPAVIAVQQAVTITATSQADGSRSASATVTLVPNAPPASITLIQSVSGRIASASQISVALPSAVTAGNLLVIAVSSWPNAPAATAITDSLGNIYSPAGTVRQSPASRAYTGIYYAKNVIGGADTVVFHGASGGTELSVVAAEFAGADTTSPLDAAGGSAGYGSTPSSGDLTPTVAGDLVIGAGTHDGVRVTNAGSGFAMIAVATEDSDNYQPLAMEYKLATTTAEVAATFSLSNDDQWAQAGALFRKSSQNVIAVSVSPSTATLSAAQTQQFTASVTNTANTAVTWTVTQGPGSVDAAGLYTAPANVAAQQTATLTATSVADPSKSATATITLLPVTITVSPATTTLFVSQTQQFAATVGNTTNPSVTWSINPSVGTVSASGLYTAPSSLMSQQTVTVTATTQADGTKTASAVITLPPVTLTLSPGAATLYGSQTQQFTATVSNAANTNVTWSLSPNVGSVSGSGLYTAPATIDAQQTIALTATSQADNTKAATSTITLMPPGGGGFNVIGKDVTVFVDGQDTMTTPAFSTVTQGDLLVAFVGYDGPSASQQTATVSGAGLTWTRLQRANTQAGTSEIWSARATGLLSNATVTSQPGTGGYKGSMTVIAFTNALGTGLLSKASAASGPPDVSISGVSAGNWVFAVGNDWDSAVTRVPVSGQVLVHQRVDTQIGDTYWVQSTTAPATADGLVNIHDSSPTNDRWNYAAVEIVATHQ
ncbi:MAG: beta strand repeat-containing protein [Acidobacteriota bacterium]